MSYPPPDWKDPDPERIIVGLIVLSLFAAGALILAILSGVT